MSRAIDIHTTTTKPLAKRRDGPRLPAASLALSIFPARVSAHGIVEPCAALFVDVMQREALTHVRAREVPREGVALRDLDGVALSWRGEEYHDVVLTRGRDAVAMLTSHRGSCEIIVAARDDDAAARHVAELGDRVRDEAAPDTAIPVNFWSYDDGYARRRQVDAPGLDEIERNYPSATRAAITRLAAADGPGPGSLLLWHGPPGTGKTHALRALAREWQEWAAVHYVSDAEAFLTKPGYLMQVATSREEDEAPVRLIVLEDAGELMSAAARTEVGQGLSRVLNLADGLLGQGLPCVVLITTNEPIGRLHPAVRRPGRCWAEVEFPAFPPHEAAAWLARAGVDREVGAPATLAELYAIADGRELSSSAAPAFGFARATAMATPPASSATEAITK